MKTARGVTSIAEELPLDLADALDDPFRDAVAGLDVEALTRRYHEDDGLILLEDFIPPAQREAMAREVHALLPVARRTHVLLVRKAEAVCHFDIVERAPTLRALQRSPSLRALFRRVTGHDLEYRDEGDPHASGLYVYNRRGDHVGWHYDDCGCAPDASFTVIAGVIDDSTSRLEVELHRKTPGRTPERRSITTRPGTFAFFRGSSVYHRVTPLGAGQERVTFSFVYVRKGFQPQGWDRLWQSTIDTFLYFGRKGVPRRNRP